MPTAQPSEPPVQTILVDCLTMLANNVIPALPQPLEQGAADNALCTEIDSLSET